MPNFDAIDALRMLLWVSIPFFCVGVIVLRLLRKKYFYAIAYPMLTVLISFFLYGDVKAGKAGKAVMNITSIFNWFNLIWESAVVSGIITLLFLYFFLFYKNTVNQGS